MTPKLTILSVLIALQAGAAAAKDDCFAAMADWQPREAVVKLAADNGWTPRRIKIDDGCYEIYGTDAQGRRIEVTIHPKSLQIIEIEYEDHEEGEDERSDLGLGHD